MPRCGAAWQGCIGRMRRLISIDTKAPTAAATSEMLDLTAEQRERRDRLVEILRSVGRVAVAFSGGIDSTVVAKAAHLALGANAVAVTADSACVARRRP